MNVSAFLGLSATAVGRPYPFLFDGSLSPATTGLVVDMQTGFCGLRGYVDAMGCWGAIAADRQCGLCGDRYRAEDCLASWERGRLCAAVSAGLGCGIVWELEVSGQSSIRSIPIEAPALASTDYVACLKTESARRVIRAFFQVARSLPADRSALAGLPVG